MQGKPLDVEPINSSSTKKMGRLLSLFGSTWRINELTLLAEAFFEKEMRRLQNEWVNVLESSQRQSDIDLAVAGRGYPFMIRRMLNWLNDLESGVENLDGLEKRIDKCVSVVFVWKKSIPAVVRPHFPVL